MKIKIGKSILRRISKFISHYEKVLLAILAVVIVISGGFWYRQFSSQQSTAPTVGGTYVEGVVADKKEITQITTRLTRSGLFAINSEGNIEPQLVSSWSSNDQKNEYKLELFEDVNRDEILQVLEERTDILGDATITPEDDRIVNVSFTEPSPSFPLLMTRPLFEYGPYKLSKSTEQTIVFTRNTRKHAVTAYINKIVLHVYPGTGELQEALRRNRLEGAIAVDGMMDPKNYLKHDLKLNRYYAVVFNVNKTPFRDPGLRTALVSSSPASAQSFTLIAPEQEPYKSLAETTVATWRGLGANVELSLKPINEVTDSIGPSRDFQAILVGIDYGPELDPFYVWHSTQVRLPGNNISGIRNDGIDVLVSQIRNSTNAPERQRLITDLHGLIQQQAVATILKQEMATYYMSDKIRYVDPFVPTSESDRFLSVALWSVK